MQNWRQILSIDRSIGYSREMLLEICKVNSHCPATLEAKYNLIGSMDKFCKAGCSVICLEEYLDMRYKPCAHY